MKHALLVALAGPMLLGLGACRGADPAAGDPLDGTAWELAAYGETRPIPGTTLTAAFEDGGVRGSAGCNSYFGSYQVSGDQITVGDLAITEMACLEPEGAMQQETVYVKLLADAHTFRLVDGQLQVSTSGGEALTFDPQP
jgi:heat shock protein HslJ